MPVYGPNMRHELAVMTHGDTWPVLGSGVYGGYGHWIIYHHSYRNDKSRYWNEDYKEAVGGPIYETYPLLIKTRRYRGLKARESVEDIVPPGLLDENHYLYYIEYFIPVQIEDFIYEIRNNIGVHPPSPPYRVASKMSIDWCEPIFGNEGRVEYNLVVAHDANLKY